ncbi:sterile alpha motif domain-containing protein 3-like isoform X4 [Lates japonicus]|uniref:Sterile alpha motif domain-containing protein 3-like isoform X4 n=1 Tax=Lates japonicus TaxID=270547 RepID=A0AAD3R786_LATJO|nr:sterile alpha motif domain-containing protein 3-like isoform X4 [Lates japonicus]
MRSQPTVHHHTEPRSQTEQRLNVRACEFHPAGSEDMDTQDQEENAPQDRMGEDVTVENEHQAEQGPDRLQGDMEAEKDEHQAEVEAVRRSQRSLNNKDCDLKSHQRNKWKNAHAHPLYDTLSIQTMYPTHFQVRLSMLQCSFYLQSSKRAHSSCLSLTSVSSIDNCPE